MKLLMVLVDESNGHIIYAWIDMYKICVRDNISGQLIVNKMTMCIDMHDKPYYNDNTYTGKLAPRILENELNNKNIKVYIP